MSTETHIKTLEQLQAVLGTNPDDGKPHDPLWFLALCEASDMSECYSFKDIASVLIGGVPPMSERWQEVLGYLGLGDEDEDGHCWPTEEEVQTIAIQFGYTL